MCRYKLTPKTRKTDNLKGSYDVMNIKTRSKNVIKRGIIAKMKMKKQKHFTERAQHTLAK